MPTYTYRCQNCSHQFDIYQSFVDQPLRACPKCKKHLLSKVYKPSGVSFKGSGFYVTDKRSAAHTAKKAAKATENGKSEVRADKSETKTETKTESKTEKKSETSSEKNKPAAKAE
ncbi:MAG: FmdB family zinc ribbon protein [Anaerolineales bacterium]